jgi:uncharacterized membrane protein YhhN
VTPVNLALLALAAGAAVVDWGAVALGGPRGRLVERIAKPAVPLALVAFVLAWPVEPEPPAIRGWLLAGLVASLAGDLLLLPPRRFVRGLVAFLLAHVAYLVAFAAVGVDPGWLAAGAVVAAGMLATAGRVLVREARAVGLGPPVAAYAVAITLMAITATGTGQPAAIAGGWLFVASDTMLGWARLREPAPGMPPVGGRRLGVAVMVTYHLALGLIVVALLG